MIENEMTDKMQDLEQHIMECWQFVDDVKLLYKQVMDKDLHKDQDKLANALLGLSTIYEIKFERAFNTYEEALEQHYKKVDERYEDKLRELRKRIKELEARLNIRKTESFFYNVLKERDKYD